MPVFTRPDAEIHYEVHGSGFPPWTDPMDALAGRFSVVGMDRRKAGNSRGAVTFLARHAS